MVAASKTVCFVLGSVVIAAIGCEADSFRDPEDDPTQEDTAGEDGSLNRAEDGEAAEVGQPIILSDQSLIQATNGKCMRAASRTKITLAKAKCKPELVGEHPERIPSRLAWRFEADGRIRSAQFGDRCITLPTSMGGDLYLDECSPLLEARQVFPIAPSPGDWEKICSKVLNPPGVRYCATHDGRSRAYTTFQSVAPLWYREDA